MKLSLMESRLFGRVCYGFYRDEKDYVCVDESKAKVVEMIFNLSLQGCSLEKIQTDLAVQNMPSPSGKEKWTRAAIDKLLSNSKYMLHMIAMEDFMAVQFAKTGRCRNFNQMMSI